ncbi:hypothetical protein M409DRAFT_61561 [Zasmidium cellare ATCC 36951]|uniref:Uncharacterized protein n=1 Tax=Zasmidium cellare ATCC 36951 TaxID=1080233 RepID=A0A6A6BYE3_ZASCE|nr:uncharacterized protein M409DRAFT_61561 [Zasmidium cellare ATCC 36951]KAF2158549.1 hypothetical protein M409DRAFT_61561 [Zasmidium cellare ATCC 36951]
MYDWSGRFEDDTHERDLPSTEKLQFPQASNLKVNFGVKVNEGQHRDDIRKDVAYRWGDDKDRNGERGVECGDEDKEYDDNDGHGREDSDQDEENVDDDDESDDEHDDEDESEDEVGSEDEDEDEDDSETAYSYDELQDSDYVDDPNAFDSDDDDSLLEDYYDLTHFND